MEAIDAKAIVKIDQKELVAFIKEKTGRDLSVWYLYNVEDHDNGLELTYTFDD